VDSQDGRERWRYQICDAVFCQPVATAKHVYFGSRDGYGYCLERDEGGLCWKVDLGSPVISRPAVVKEQVYVVASAGRMCCLDAESGTVAWKFDIAGHSQTRPRIFSSPTVLPDAVAGGNWIYLGTELSNSVTSAAVLYCLHD
jgi:outer membrane protein assembly factor BamB